ncbi:hypothetical protein IT6_01755 [Methylacidiphilum caldifontis]|nr:hypothetical protein [Methylacidiphilum caldifontis]QSR89046.1 hypothetical protein IT6_01755 [Methylacidiphilum caldifontis]
MSVGYLKQWATGYIHLVKVVLQKDRIKALKGLERLQRTCPETEPVDKQA